MMNGKKTYKSFYEEEKLPAYLNPDFLDICCADAMWDVQCAEQDDQIVAAWIYYMKNKLGMKYITMPPAVKYMGPVFSSKVSLSERQKLFDQLSLMLPSVSSYEQNFSCSMQELYNQKEIDFEHESMDTYLLDISSDIDAIKANLNGNYRRAINKHFNSFLCDLRQKSDNQKINTFIKLLIDSMGPLENHALSKKILFKIIEYGESFNRGKLIINYLDNKPVGGAYILWDHSKAYYLYAGNNTEYNKLYPGVQTVWQCIQFLKNNTSVKTIDFYGSSIVTIAKVWQKLGAVKHEYPHVSKKPAFWFNLLQQTKNTFSKK